MSLRVKSVFFMSKFFVCSPERKLHLAPALSRFVPLLFKKLFSKQVSFVCSPERKLHLAPALSRLAIGLVLIAGLIGCASNRPGLTQPDQKPNDVLSSFPFKGEEALQKPIEIKEPTGPIVLGEAIALALVKNPELEAFSWEIRVREAKMIQAGLPLNPEITTEFQDIGGSGIYSGTNRAESTIQLSQLIELGGKRSKRKRVTSLSRNLAWWDYETKRLDVLSDVTKAFIDLLAAQERLSLNKELMDLSEQVHNTVSERVNAGKVSPVEKTKSGIALSMTRIKWKQAKRDMAIALKRLAVIWGSSSPAFKKAVGDLYSISSIESLGPLVDAIPTNPDIARWPAEMEKRRAAVEFEDSKKIPDLTLSGGVRRFNETEDNAFIAGVSIPIPLFNRNQGGSLEARHKLAKAKKERNASELLVHTSLVAAYEMLSTAHAEAMTLKNEILPGAKNAFDAVKEGFRFGKFSFLNVLDSQRTLFEAKGQYIETLATFHKAVVDVERLTGKGIVKEEVSYQDAGSMRKETLDENN